MTRRQAHLYRIAIKKVLQQRADMGRLVDLMSFYIAFTHYKTIIGMDRHIHKAMPLLTRFKEELRTLLLENIKPLIDSKKVMQVSRGFRRALLTQGRIDENAMLKGAFFEKFLTRLRMSSQGISLAFSGKELASAKLIALAARRSDSEGIVHALAKVPPASSLIQLKNWIRTAAQQLGVPLTPIENEILDNHIDTVLEQEDSPLG